MKKLFAILAVLSLLMVPCVSMASTMTDADLADVTGQMGVTIDVSNMQLALTLGTITWGDLDGFGTSTYAGYVNMVIPMIGPNTPFVMHIGVPSVTMTIDVGSTTTFGGVGNKSHVAIGISATTVTIDAIAAYIFVNNEKGGDFDYVGDSTGGSNSYFTPFSKSTYQNSKVVPLVSITSGGTFTNGAAGNSSLASDCLGVIGMSHISASVNALTVLISAH